MSHVTHQSATAGHLGDEVGKILADAESLCRAVVGRDLGETPLYIVPQSSLPPDCGAGDHCYGYTTPSLDLYLADHISSYRGRGPCMVINDLALAMDHHPDDIEYVVPAFVLHELAHILERPALFEDRTGVDPLRLKFEALVVADVGQRPVRNDLPAYFGHEAGFIRIALHLRYRALRHGVSIAPGQLCAGYRYGLSHARRYVDALGSEPARLIDASFTNIRTTKPPPAFSSLWCDDFIAFHQRFPLQKGTLP